MNYFCRANFYSLSIATQDAVYNIVLVSVINSEGPPVPIPNTEVKLVCADNTWLETAWKDRSMLTPDDGISPLNGGIFRYMGL